MECFDTRSSSRAYKSWTGPHSLQEEKHPIRCDKNRFLDSAAPVATWTLSGRRRRTSRLLLGLFGRLHGGHLGVVLLLESVPLLAVVEETIEHGRDLHVEAAELLTPKQDKSRHDHIAQCWN